MTSDKLVLASFVTVPLEAACSGNKSHRSRQPAEPTVMSVMSWTAENFIKVETPLVLATDSQGKGQFDVTKN